MIAERRLRWEAEANRFSWPLLVPPNVFRKEANASKDPDLQDIVRLARRYEVSKEVLGRAYVDDHQDPVAFVVTHKWPGAALFLAQNGLPVHNCPLG